MNNIPVDLLHNKTTVGLQIKVFRSTDKQEHIPDHPHRDDHYIFFVLKSGSGTLKIDSKEVIITGKQIYYILPSQVHQRIKTERAEGWFLALDTSLIQADLREIFERQPDLQLPYQLTDHELKRFKSLLTLLHNEFVNGSGGRFHLTIVRNLAQSFLAMAANSFDSAATTMSSHGRSAEISRQFKNLLSQHYHAIKSPSEYAAMLHVTLGHLNESVKKNTGSTVSYWIGQELFSEAKRLLNHTDNDVKQIANELGFKDHAYFVRFFRKHSGCSPLRFRKLHRT